MKTTTTIIPLLLSICFLPLLTTISAHRPPFIRLPTQAAGSAVKDFNGRDVVGGDIYFAYAYPPIGVIGVEGGISVANFKNLSLCPSDVFLNLSTPQFPAILRPIIFHPFDNSTGEVQEFVQTYIEFYETNPGNQCPVKWKLDQDLIVTGDEPSTFIITASDDSFPDNTYIFFNIGIAGDHDQLGTNTTPTYAYQFFRAGPRA